MKLHALTERQFKTRMDFLVYTSGPDLKAEVLRAAQTDDENPAKVIETLESIQRYAGECAKYLREKEPFND